MKHLLITLPSTVKWEDYMKELKAVESGHAKMSFKLPTLPKHAGVGSRCYVAHRGSVVGYMTVTGLGMQAAFVCSTTGGFWPDGVYVHRSGVFTYLTPGKYPQKGFQGYRYTPELN